MQEVVEIEIKPEDYEEIGNDIYHIKEDAKIIYSNDNVRPKITTIVIDRMLADEEIERNLEKETAKYIKIKDEIQPFLFNNIKNVRKVTLYSSIKNKFKVFIFI